MTRSTLPLLTLSLAAAFFSLSLSLSSSRGEDWPGWRGPRGDGTSHEDEVPVKWSGKTGENIAWQVEIPGEGHASPIVHGDRIFLVTCLTGAEQRALLCLDRRSGKTLWQRTVVESPLESKHSLNSFASGTPATDGERVYVCFLEVGDKTISAPNVGNKRDIKPGRLIAACYSAAGDELWKTAVGPFISAHGFCTSPVLFEDLVIVNGDHDGESYIAALDRATGEVRWKRMREHKTRSYVTPIIRDFDGRMQMILSGSKSVVSLDPRDGSRHWVIDGPTEQFVASMVDNGKYVFLTAGFPDRHVLAIRPDGEGNVSDSHVVWRTTRNCSYVPSPIVVGDYFLVAADNGVVTCYLAETGETQWIERMAPHYSASLVSAGGLAYFLADDGVMKVVRPGGEFVLVAENELGEHCYASPAISQGQVFIRGEKQLYCIGEGE